MRDSIPRTLQTTIIFLVVGGILALALGGYLGPVSNAIGGSLVGVQTWLATRFTAVQLLLAEPRDVTQLRQENADLQSEVAGLQAQIIELQEQAAQSSTLAALVDFSREHPGNQYKASAVIGRDPSPFLHYVIIDAGSNAGIRRGMPVVTEKGLIGRVDAVIGGAARVQLITDPNSAVAVKLRNAKTESVLIGSISGDLGLQMLSQDANVEKDDLVFTSGLGGGFPPDLLVGQVLTVHRRESDLFQDATVQPVVDFSDLGIVLVILNFRPVDITPLIPGQNP
jgi:rod shape-determining protein MreC